VIFILGWLNEKLQSHNCTIHATNGSEFTGITNCDFAAVPHLRNLEEKIR